MEVVFLSLHYFNLNKTAVVPYRLRLSETYGEQAPSVRTKNGFNDSKVVISVWKTKNIQAAKKVDNAEACWMKIHLKHSKNIKY